MDSQNFSDGFIDPRTRRFILPHHVVASEPGFGSILNGVNLLKQDLSCCSITSGKTAPAYLILDFGQELNGGICIHTVGTSPRDFAKVRIRFGESVSEVMTYPSNDHAIHDVCLDLPCRAKQEFGNTGFRFVRVDLLDAGATITIQQIHAVILERPYEYLGSFECSDTLLNEIWRVGARTVHLCCQDSILDGIKRDRMVWSGDIHPQVHVIANVFGDQSIVEDTLDGLAESFPATTWMNGISSYNLWWLISLWEWYVYTGKSELLQKYEAYLRGQSALLFRHIDTNGHECLGDGRFLDWTTVENEELLKPGLQALLVWAVQCLQKCFHIIGATQDAEACEKTRARLTSAVLPVSSNPSVQALRVHAGLADAAAVNRDYLQHDPCEAMSPWFGYYRLNVKAMAGDVAGALNMIRSYWGGMVKLGATSFWEHFNLDWIPHASRIDELPDPSRVDVHKEYGEYCYESHRLSMCHGWSAGPTAWLTRYVLGVRIVEPGYKVVEINPALGGLVYARGTIPTPYGPMMVHHYYDKNHQLISDIQAPEGVTILKAAESSCRIDTVQAAKRCKRAIPIS